MDSETNTKQKPKKHTCSLKRPNDLHHPTVTTPYGNIDVELAPLVTLFNDHGITTEYAYQGGKEIWTCVKCKKDCQVTEKAHIIFPNIDHLDDLYTKLLDTRDKRENTNSNFTEDQFLELRMLFIHGFEIHWGPVSRKQCTWRFPNKCIGKYYDLFKTLLEK